MRVVRPRQGKCRVATWTPLGSQLLDRRGREKRLAMAQMTRFPARFPGRGGSRTLARLLVGRVRRRWPVGGRGILLEPGFQDFDALLELTQCIAYGAQIGLHGRRGLFPVVWGKGKWPAGVGGLR